MHILPRMRIGIWTLIIAVVILGTARLVYVKLAVLGEGIFADSPNGRRSAEMWSYHGLGDRDWTVLSISEGDQVVWEQRLDGEYFGRDSSSVTWTPDSSLVTFSAGDTNSNLGLTVSVQERNGRFVTNSGPAP